jgi:hypothetical protein
MVYQQWYQQCSIFSSSSSRLFSPPGSSSFLTPPPPPLLQFGLDHDLPPFCAATGAAAATAAYASRDVRYIQGNNDTCNEALIPGCVSHGLETTCMDMFEGRFRHERGVRYAAYLEVYYGKPTHRLRIVPDVGHDHTLMWDGSLEIIFGDD